MCFSWIWLRDLLVWLVMLAAAIAILRILIPWALSWFGAEGGIIAQVLNIVLWAIVAIAVIYICFTLIACLLGGGAALLPPLPHR